jgi:hypothetical protein
VLAAVGGFDARLCSGGDRDLGPRIVAAGWELAYAPAAVVCHGSRGLMALVCKARRLAGQEWVRARIAGTGLRGTLQAEWQQYRRRVRRPLTGDGGIGWPDRAAFTVLATAFQAVRFAEVLRLEFLGGHPERR